MIVLHQLNGVEFALNIDLIEIIKESPDTRITLTTGRLYIAKESMQQVLQAILEYKRSVYKNLLEGNFSGEE